MVCQHGAVSIARYPRRAKRTYAQVHAAAATFVKLFWDEQLERGDAQASVPGREACLLLTHAALSLDCVTSPDALLVCSHLVIDVLQQRKS